MKRGTTLFLALAIVLSSGPVSAAPTVKQGAACKQLGQVRKALGKTYVCKKRDGRLVSIQRPASPAAPLPKPPVTAGDLASGLVLARYAGYFGDDFGWFSEREPQSVKTGSSLIDLQSGDGAEYSLRWTGYFRPNATGQWILRMKADDASYLWLGVPAVDSTPKMRTSFATPGIHAPVSKAVTVTLDRDSYYPIRLLYGNAMNWAQVTFSVQGPSMSAPTTDLSGLVFHSPVSTESASGIDPDWARTTPSVSAAPLYIAPYFEPTNVVTEATRFIQQSINAVDVKTSVNRTALVMHVEPGLNGEFPQIAETATAFALDFYSALGFTLLQPHVDFVMGRTDTWLYATSDKVQPGCIRPGTSFDPTGSYALCPTPSSGAIYTNLPASVTGKSSVARDLDLTYVVEGTDWWVAWPHELFHNWQEGFAVGQYPSWPQWLWEGSAQIFGYMTYAKYLNTPHAYEEIDVARIGWDKTICTTDIQVAPNGCGYSQGMVAVEYLIWRIGWEKYRALYAAGDFRARFHAVTGQSLEEFYTDVNAYLRLKGWGLRK